MSEFAALEKFIFPLHFLIMTQLQKGPLEFQFVESLLHLEEVRSTYFVDKRLIIFNCKLQKNSEQKGIFATEHRAMAAMGG